MKDTGEIRKRTTAFKRIPVRWISRTWTRLMKGIAFLSILFAALIEFAIERASFDLWMVAVVTIVTLLGNVAGRALRFHMDSHKHHKSEPVFQGIVAYVHESEHQIVPHRIGSWFRWSVRGKVV